MSDQKDNQKQGRARETFLVHGNPRDEQWNYDYHVIPPITASTTFRLDSVDRGAQGFATFSSPAVTEPGQKPIYIYDRLAEPTTAMLENSFKEVEGGKSATAFASGMAAISAAFFSLCEKESEIVAHRLTYGCTYSLLTNWLPRLGITPVFGDLTDLESAASLITPKTRVIYFESPVNPTLDIIDIGAMAELARGQCRTPRIGTHLGRGRQHLRHALLSAPVESGGGRGRALVDQERHGLWYRHGGDCCRPPGDS